MRLEEKPLNSLFFSPHFSCFFYFTICPKSIEPFYKVSYYIKWVTTSWTHSIFSTFSPLSLYQVKIWNDMTLNYARKKYFLHSFFILTHGEGIFVPENSLKSPNWKQQFSSKCRSIYNSCQLKDDRKHLKITLWDKKIYKFCTIFKLSNSGSGTKSAPKASCPFWQQ